MLATGTSLSTSAAALATPLGPWLPNPPIDVSTTGQDAGSPQVAIGPDGTTTITWIRSNGTNNIVQAATRAANATTFSTPIDVSTTGQDADSPQVATGPDGTTTITWRRFNGSNTIVQAAIRAANATNFSDPINLSATLQDADSPQVATGPDGTTTITWYRWNGSKNIVQAATRAANATTFSTPIDVSTTGQDALSPQVATGPDGTTTITWWRSTGPNYLVQAATRAANDTTFSTPIDVSTTGQDALSPQVATGPDGTTTITWQRYNGTHWIVQAATRAANATTFSTPMDLSTTGQDAESPQLATGPDGTTTITWPRSNGSNTFVQAATRAANATTFSTPIDVSTTGQDAGSPQVATGPDGTTTITWTSSNGTNTIVQAATRAANATTFSTPINLSTTGQDADRPQVATGPQGATTITWSRSNGTNTIVQAVTTTFTPRTPTNIRWNTGKRTTNQPITGSFTATLGVTYTITATSSTSRRLQTRATRTVRGTCKVTTNKKTKKRTATCTIRLKKAGTWLIKITPAQNGLAGTPATKTIKVRVATKKTRTLHIHQRQILAQR